MTDQEKILLLVEVPATNDKKELAAEQMFAAIHGILRPPKRRILAGDSEQEYISFEVAAIDQRIHFYVWLPLALRSFVESQIYAQYSSAQIVLLAEDYVPDSINQPIVSSTELKLNNHETIPISTFKNFDVDPLSGITAALASLDPGEQIWLQILTRPINDDWHKKSQKQIKKIETGSSGSSLVNFLSKPEEITNRPNLSDRDNSQIAAIKQKSTKLGYQVKIRLVYLGQNKVTANLRLQAVVGAFKQFNTTDLNGFSQGKSSFDLKKIDDYRQRQFKDPGFILNIEELASVFHLPHTSVDTPNIVWASSKTAEPPASIPTKEKHPPEAISLFGSSNFRASEQIFGCLRSDRGRHVYIIGQTGTGKTGLLELLALSDINFNQGYAVVDPHGDFAINNLLAIPKERCSDVVYFNPADTEFPIGFNPLEVTDVRQKSQITSELVGVLKRMFDSWGPRLEYILRNTILALLDTPNTTMLDITRMLTDKKFRKKVISNIEDVVVKNFWEGEFNSWDNKFQTEAVAPVFKQSWGFYLQPNYPKHYWPTKVWLPYSRNYGPG